MKRFKQILLRMPFILIPAYFFGRIRHGFTVYCRLCQGYGENAELYSAFLPSSGDVFFAASVFRSLVKRDGTEKNALFVVMGEGERRIADLFQLPKVLTLTGRESNNLLRMYRFLNGKSILPFHILHYQPSQMHIGICQNVLSFRGLNFLSMLRIVAYRSDFMLAMESPHTIGTVQDFSTRYGGIPGKTVVLSPYAACMDQLPIAFWEQLATGLKQRGYSVCTNCAGTRELPVPGTSRVDLSYQDILAFLEWAGYLIALRSGLVDITYAVSCKRIILYPKENFNVWGIGAPIDCFSLKNMGLRDDAVELEYDGSGTDELYARVSQAVKIWDL